MSTNTRQEENKQHREVVYYSYNTGELGDHTSARRCYDSWVFSVPTNVGLDNWHFSRPTQHKRIIL
jgi:hypothetical protein